MKILMDRTVFYSMPPSRIFYYVTCNKNIPIYYIILCIGHMSLYLKLNLLLSYKTKHDLGLSLNCLLCLEGYHLIYGTAVKF